MSMTRFIKSGRGRLTWVLPEGAELSFPPTFGTASGTSPGDDDLEGKGKIGAISQFLNTHFIKRTGCLNGTNTCFRGRHCCSYIQTLSSYPRDKNQDLNLYRGRAMQPSCETRLLAPRIKQCILNTAYRPKAVVQSKVTSQTTNLP